MALSGKLLWRKPSASTAQVLTTGKQGDMPPIDALLCFLFARLSLSPGVQFVIRHGITELSRDCPVIVQ